jgi:hypothetical protein
MSELALIQKAIEESQQKMSQLFDAQKAEIESTGKVSKQLQADLAKVQEELTKSGTASSILNRNWHPVLRIRVRRNPSLNELLKSSLSHGTVNRAPSTRRRSTSRSAVTLILLAH